MLKPKNHYLGYREGKRKITMSPKMGKIMDTCATINETYICCNIKVVKSVKNCPFDCSYCFLQDYLNDGKLTLVQDHHEILKDIKEKCEQQPWRLFRIGTWELGDSLALESIAKQAQSFIPAFKSIPNALLELKTKSNCVSDILNLDHQHKTVVSWSLNPKKIIHEHEHKTASFDERLSAIHQVVKAGYLIGLHFDPMILHHEWEKGYEELIHEVFDIVPVHQIAWISIGSLRFNPEMKQKMQENFPKSTLAFEEMNLGPDGKMRYIKPLRISLYQHLFNLIKEKINLTAIPCFSKENPLIYFCMERFDVWEKIFGKSPSSIQELDYLFAASLYHRFKIGPKPQKRLYQKIRDE